MSIGQVLLRRGTKRPAATPLAATALLLLLQLVVLL